MTIATPRLRDWLPRLLSGRPHQIIGDRPHPYLLRWYIIPRNPVFNIYLHKFLRSDDDRALHDHPWWFVSLMLSGCYDEVTEQGVRRRRAGSIAFRRAEWRHRVALVRRGLPSAGQVWEVPCWTLILTGRRSRVWGFWCKRNVDPWTARTNEELDRVTANRGPYETDRFIKWDEFGDAGCGEPS